MKKRKWKVGDLFKSGYDPEKYGGTILEIVGIHGGEFPFSCEIHKGNEKIKRGDSAGNWKDDGDMRFIRNVKNTNMNSLVQKFRLMSKTEPEKSFIKKGVMDIDGNLTEEGTALFLAFLVEKNKVEFNKDVVSQIEVEEEGDK